MPDDFFQEDDNKEGEYIADYENGDSDFSNVFDGNNETNFNLMLEVMTPKAKLNSKWTPY